MPFLILAVFLFLLYLLTETLVRGKGVSRGIRWTKGTVDRDAIVRLHGHRSFASIVSAVAVIAVLLTEIFVRLKGGASGGPLFWIHLCFAIPFFVLLLSIRFYATGLRNPKLHRRLVYSCLVAFAGTLVTGAPLLVYRAIAG